MKMTDLQDLLKHELDDLYSAEKQITKALPKMAQAASSPKLKAAFQAHLQETQEHVVRLEAAYRTLRLTPGRHKCEAMEGLLKEGEELIKSKSEPDVLDAALIGAAQRVEHYEMAAYGCARTYARVLGQNTVADLLQRTLDEDGSADKKLTVLAETGINVEAIDGKPVSGSTNGGARRPVGQAAVATPKVATKTTAGTNKATSSRAPVAAGTSKNR